MTDVPAPQFTTAEYDETLTDSHGLFARGLMFGIGGAAIGFLLYTTVGIVTGLEIGYVSLAVGYLVGKGVVMGSRGRTGRRYQVAAAMLTYGAVSLSAIPMTIWHFAHEKPEDPATTISTTVTAGPTVAAQQPAAGAADASESSGSGVVGAIVFLALIGLASPFLGLASPVQGLIGLVILFVGIQIAWKITGRQTPSVAPVAPAMAGESDKPTSLDLRG